MRKNLAFAQNEKAMFYIVLCIASVIANIYDYVADRFSFRVKFFLKEIIRVYYKGILIRG